MIQPLTPRQQSIGLHLLHQRDFETVGSLASRFRVSSRTIRYDLNRLEDWFRKQGLELDRRPRRGVILRGTESGRSLAKKQLNAPSPRIVPLTREERIRFIIASLLQHPERVTLDEWVRELDVSRGTLLKDLKIAEKRLAAHGVVVERIPGFGIRLRAEEFHWRQAAASLLTDSWASGELRLFLRRIREGTGGTSDRDPFGEWLPQKMTRKIESALFRWGSPLIQELSDRALQGLVVHIGLAIIRLRKHKDLVMSEGELADLKGLPEFLEAKRLSDLLEEKFQVTIPEEETGYLTLHLLGAQRSRVSLPKDGEKDQPIGRYVDAIIHIVEETLQLPLKTDQELREGLLAHLQPALVRLRYGFFIKNPIVKEIRSRYPQIYAASQKAAFWLERETGYSVPPEEIGYITMHMGAAVMRLKEKEPMVRRVLLVCASGVGTAKLLESFLRRELPGVSWAGVTSAARAREVAEQTRADFVVSTVPMEPSSLDLPVFTIKPVPNREEIERLRKALLLDHPQVASPSISRLMELIEAYADIHDRAGLEQTLQGWATGHLSRPPAHHSSERTRYDPMLDQLLRKEHILVGHSCTDWREVVRTGSAPLLKQGMIESSYVEQIERNLVEHGAYMVIAPGIALLHARPEDGVNAVCMSLVTLKNPVCFGHEQNDPVDVAITFAALDNNMHLAALSQLMELLSDEASMKKLREAQTVEQVTQIIQPFVS
ncbi:sugar transporter [Marinithermofilum abyssi]|uniref:Sugar transporter n=1 Tax=Marinithermofilum abyssi TaxID=1571185 RepID=A0A8J2VIE1_9BACL|nr:BglG family transcription antiterminator [Marinithermofilum abyssi]GGE15439.1 sugar transporter [Marinithermofilum abyssi]